jgi:Flp pilus assembly protein TadB
MSSRGRVAVGGVVVGLILLLWIPWWLSVLIVLGVPAVAYFSLDSSQRRRLRRISRRQIGR